MKEYKIKVNDEVDRIITYLVRMTDSKDFGEMLQKALSVYRFLLEETGLGAELILHRPNGENKEIDLAMSIKEINDT